MWIPLSDFIISGFGRFFMCKVPARVCAPQPAARRCIWNSTKNSSSTHSNALTLKLWVEKMCRTLKLNLNASNPIQSNPMHIRWVDFYMVNKFKYICGVLSAGVHRQQSCWWRRKKTESVLKMIRGFRMKSIWENVYTRRLEPCLLRNTLGGHA